MNLANQCAQAMFSRDAASQGMGMRLLSVAPGCARLGMSVRADMIQGHGTCHGGYLIDYIAPAHLGDTLSADCREQSRSGRTGNYDVRIENQLGQLIALFHGKSYKVRGTVLAQENPNE
eukprot:gene17197-20611_t